MDTVVVITDAAPRDSDVIGALRASSLRIVRKRLDDDVEELVLDKPDVIVLDVPDDRRVGPLVRPIADAQGLAEVPLVAVVGEAGLQDCTQLAQLVDFVLRPLRDEELVARVKRPLRTQGRDTEDRLSVGELVVDVKGYEASIAGERLDLTYQEFELLKFLVSHPGQAFTRDQLLSRVWGYDYYGGSRTVDIHVRRIRAKLGHPYAGHIQTIRHVGYKWQPEDDV